VPSFLPRPLRIPGPLLLLLPLLAATPTGEAVSAAACAAVAARPDRAHAVQPIATCDACRTSGRRAGYKQCCEQVGGDYRCEWVPC